MPDIQDYIGMNDIKGTDFDPDTDSLRQINQKTIEVSNQTIQLATQTEIVRADTGELNGTAVNDLYVTNNMTLTGNITVKNLYILDGATLNGSYTLVVQNDCYIYSSTITGLNTLDVRGNLISQRKIGDTSTTCVVNVTNLNVLGTVTANNTTLTSSVTKLGNTFDSNTSACNLGDCQIENNITVIGNTFQANPLYCSGDVDVTDAGIYGVFNADNVILTNSFSSMTSVKLMGDLTITASATKNITIAELNCLNATLTDVQLLAVNTELIVDNNFTLTNVSTNITTDIQVKNNCNFTNCTYTILKTIIDGTLTIDNIPAIAGLRIHADNFIYTGTSLISNGVLNTDQNGASGGAGLKWGSGSGASGGSGGTGAQMILNITSDFTANNLTSIQCLASNGGAGGNVGTYSSGSGGGGGGGCLLDIMANQILTSNTVVCQLTAGNGGAGASQAGNLPEGAGGGGGGGGGSIGAAGGTEGSRGSGGSLWGGLGGLGGSSPQVNIRSTNSFSDYTLNLTNGTGAGGGSGHNSGNGGSGGTGNVNSTTTAILVARSTYSYTESYTFKPSVPTLVTASSASDPTILEFTCPTFIENVNLDFSLEVEQQFTEKIFQTVVSKNTNDDAGDFSGTPPYIQASANVSYTLPSLLTGTYRWRVKSLKDSDIAIESLFSDWRLFTVT